jgi:hypothetical protein
MIMRTRKVSGFRKPDNPVHRRTDTARRLAPSWGAGTKQQISSSFSLVVEVLKGMDLFNAARLGHMFLYGQNLETRHSL